MANQFEKSYSQLSKSIKDKIEILYQSNTKIDEIVKKTSLSRYLITKHLKNVGIFEVNRDTIIKQPSKKNPKVSETNYAKKWDYDKNELGPEHFTTGSDKKVWWKCNNCKLSWDAAIHSICNEKTNTDCPFCALKRASHFHNLELKFPVQAKQFLVDKNKILPSEITPGSQKLYWWKCKNNHIFENSPLNMTRPYAKEKEICDYCPGGNKAWPGESFGDLYPHLLSEIDREIDKDFDEFSVKPGSHKKINWKCIKGHKWKTAIYSRAIEGYGCKKCKMPYSRQEVRIYSELKLLFNDTKIRYSKFKEEIDIYIPSLNLAIEFDGFYWHKNKFERDINKTKKLLSKNIKVIRIREGLEEITGNNIKIPVGIFTNHEFVLVLNEIRKIFKEKSSISKINERIHLEEFQNDRLYLKILSDMPAPVYENSLEYVYPKTAKKWDYEKNFPLSPDQISKGTNEKYWFKCDESHSFDAPISAITKNDNYCPYCTSRRINKSNSLAALYPEIAKFWDYEKNYPLKPEEVAPNYNKHVWWICSENHPPHKGTCNKKVNSKSGCPYCSGNRATPELSIKKLYPDFFSKIKKIDKIHTQRKSNQDELLHMGEGTHTKVIIDCENCKREISKEVRGFVKMIKNNNPNKYLCSDCKTLDINIIKELIAKKLTINEIATKLDTTYSEVHHYLKINNLVTITDSEKKSLEDREILKCILSGMTGRAVAKKFNCSEARVSTIKNGHNRKIIKFKR